MNKSSAYALVIELTNNAEKVNEKIPNVGTNVIVPQYWQVYLSVHNQRIEPLSSITTAAAFRRYTLQNTLLSTLS